MINKVRKNLGRILRNSTLSISLRSEENVDNNKIMSILNFCDK